MEELIKNIKKNKTPVVFVSPHLDDAALSCGELMRTLSKFTKVTVINVFTTADNKSQTMSAKKALADSQYATPVDLYKERVKEDKIALSSIKVAVKNLGYTEALWRKIKKPSVIQKHLSKLLPEFIHVYPTYKLHISKGIISMHDNDLITEISANLKKNISPKAIVFAPFGVGNHVDHIVTRKAVEKVFHPIYWIDQPYIERKKVELPSYNTFPVNDTSKKTLVSFYKTQINLLFPNGDIPHLEELFVIDDKKNTIPFPEKIGMYSFVEELHTDKSPKPYHYALYKNNDGKKAFAKVWVNEKKNKEYTMLKNEINVYRFITEEINRNPALQKGFPNIHIPKFMYANITESQIILLLEYVQGELLGNKKNSVQMKTAALKEIFAFFNALNANLDIKQISADIPVRGFVYWILFLAYSSLKLVLSHPKYLSFVFMTNLFIFKNIKLTKQIGFVHRDIGEWNTLVNKKGLWIYDFQLACFTNPVFEYAITSVKIANNTKLFNSFNQKVVSYHLKDEASKKLLLAYSLILFLYEICLSNQPKNEPGYKRISEYLKSGKSLLSLPLVLRLLLENPRNYLFSFTFSSTKSVAITPYNNKIKKEAMTIINEVKKYKPMPKIHFVGSASLGIAGQPDIDLMAEASYKDFDKYFSNMKFVLGEPSKIKKKIIEWNYYRNGYHVTFSLIDPSTPHFKERMLIHYALKTNKRLLKKYEKLKNSLQGVNERTYTIKQIEFFNNIERAIKNNEKYA